MDFCKEFIDKEFLGIKLQTLLLEMPWLIENYVSMFFLEMKNVRGDEYSPKTLYIMIALMQCALKDAGAKSNILTSRAPKAQPD